jgi:2-oxoglutarate ferredoxin oxidoreductase subunit gamma
LKTEIRIAGLGGQGVVLAGEILGRAAVYEGRNVVQTQSYGAEARGSIARSEVIISDEKINFPAIRKSDVLIAMNQEAVDKYLKELRDNGILIFDSTYVKEDPKTNAKIFKISATENAERTFGTKVYANIVMIGALTRITGVVSQGSIEKAIENTLPQKVIATNLQAYQKGQELIRQNHRSDF